MIAFSLADLSTGICKCPDSIFSADVVKRGHRTRSFSDCLCRSFIIFLIDNPLAGTALHFPHLKSISDFRIAIAIAILLKNRSGKIGDRFSW
jgi:hypothetical protein